MVGRGQSASTVIDRRHIPYLKTLGPIILTINTNETGHIFSNKDINASRQIVSYLLEGIQPTEPLFTEDTQE